MFSNKIKLIIKTLVISAMIVLTLACGGVVFKAYAMPSNGRVEQRQSKGKILIYHSHTCEKNKDSTVVDIGEDLSQKLRKKGYDVEHIKDDFSRNYNSAYLSSSKMLETKDLSQYSIILDIHIDASDNPIITKDKNGNNVARCMWVQTKNNQYLQEENYIANNITNEMSKFGNIMKNIHCQYYNGIRNYNLSMNSNMLLLEVGGNNNDFISCKRANTYMASSIDTYINNSLKFK